MPLKLKSDNTFPPNSFYAKGGEMHYPTIYKIENIICIARYAIPIGLFTSSANTIGDIETAIFNIDANIHYLIYVRPRCDPPHAGP